jgi:hypothetical protein
MQAMERRIFLFLFLSELTFWVGSRYLDEKLPNNQTHFHILNAILALGGFFFFFFFLVVRTIRASFGRPWGSFLVPTGQC